MDELDQPGAQRGRSHEQLAETALAAVPGEVVEEVGEVGAELGVAAEQPEVLVEPGGLLVVVPGADVAVAADASGLAAHHERGLGMGLQSHQPVHDVHPRLLEHPGPGDVRRLVEACGELDERHHLLARLGGGDEGLHDRAVRPGGAVEGLLDREHVGVARRLLDERLDRGREGVVGEVDEDVAAGDDLEEVGRALVGAAEPDLGGRLEGRVVEVGAVEAVQRPQAAEVERAVDAVDRLLADLELAHQQVEHLAVHRRVDLQAHHPR